VTWRTSVVAAPISLIKSKAFDVRPLQAELEGVEWNAIRLRSEHPQSPHREVDDIWVRYNPIENYDGDMGKFNGEHIAKWYPIAEQLPQIKRAAIEVFDYLEGHQLGFVLITRIKPGKQCYPHIDQGWHARYYDKFCLQIKGNQDQTFKFDHHELKTQDGDLFWFNNAFPHAVVNNSTEDRISMIICIRQPNQRGA
jgi:Aspartyl/Asparaginyl beta-hydroxylase